MIVRPLRKEDDRSSFRSAHPDLDRFFHGYAGQNQFKLFIGVTYVAEEGDRIVGFVTVAAGHLEIDDLPEARRKRLPHYPLPILRLSRMASHIEWRGRGIGKALLLHVFELALQQSETSGCLGIVVDAKAEAISFYEPFGFFPLEVVEGESSARPAPRAMFLPLGDIGAALGPEGP